MLNETNNANQNHYAVGQTCKTQGILFSLAHQQKFLNLLLVNRGILFYCNIFRLLRVNQIQIYIKEKKKGALISIMYSRVSFYDASFYDDSLLRPLSSRTENSRLVMNHYRISSVLSLLSALSSFPLCTCFFFFYFSAVLFKLIAIFPPMT